MKAKNYRPVSLGASVLYLDGLTGTGKTMMAPLLSSLNRVEIGKFEHLHEYLGALDFLRKIEPDTAEFLIKMYADLGIYNASISREINFRPGDLSGILQNPGTFQYVMRLFLPDGDRVVSRIEKKKPILHIVTHQSLGVMDVAFRALGERVFFIEMVRHPLYLLDHWHSYIDRHGVDPRDFTIWIQYGTQNLPWFAFGWEERYIESSGYDRVVYSIDWLTTRVKRLCDSLPEHFKKQILFLPFEHFVLDPDPYIVKLEELLSAKRTSKTARVMRQQKIPRVQVTAGPNKKIYRKYAWTPPKRRDTDAIDVSRRWERARKNLSSEAFEVLERLVNDYQTEHGDWY